MSQSAFQHAPAFQASACQQVSQLLVVWYDVRAPERMPEECLLT
jgi:hypothetical protein